MKHLSGRGVIAETVGWVRRLSFQHSPARDQREARSRSSPRVLLTTPKSFQSPTGFGAQLVAHEGRPPREPRAPAHTGASWESRLNETATGRALLSNSELPVALTRATCWAKASRGLAEHAKEQPAPSLGSLPLAFGREPGTFSAAPWRSASPPQSSVKTSAPDVRSPARGWQERLCGCGVHGESRYV